MQNKCTKCIYPPERGAGGLVGQLGDGVEGQCEEAPGMFANFITLGSMLLVLVSLPFSLFFVVKVVQVIADL